MRTSIELFWIIQCLSDNILDDIRYCFIDNVYQTLHASCFTVYIYTSIDDELVLKRKIIYIKKKITVVIIKIQSICAIVIICIWYYIGCTTVCHTFSIVLLQCL